MNRSSRKMHHIINIFFALTLLIFLAPVFLIISIFIKLTSRGPVLHWSKRIGQNNSFFQMPKFRTMRTDTPQLATHLLKEAGSFITPVGSFLRKTSLDELPQLFSIIKRDMNFVGPRPALFNQDDLKAMRTKVMVHTLKPGVTGWAQINGRDEIELEKKVEFDKEYLSKRNLFFDMKIIFLTFYKILSKENVKH